jgi:Capsule polysaccharide biosynthesis protein
MDGLLKQVDEVHVLTSLTLFRRKVVVCYGLPLYAGWGLTKDRLAHYGTYERRPETRGEPEEPQKPRLEASTNCGRPSRPQ